MQHLSETEHILETRCVSNSVSISIGIIPRTEAKAYAKVVESWIIRSAKLEL